MICWKYVPSIRFLISKDGKQMLPKLLFGSHVIWNISIVTMGHIGCLMYKTHNIITTI